MTITELYLDFRRNYMEVRLRPSTIRGYAVNMENHALPLLGDKELERLTVEDLDRLSAELLARLSAKSVVYVHASLRKMLNYAIRRGYISANPYGMFDMPRVNKYRYTVLDREQKKRLLTACVGTPIEAPVFLSLRHGLRRGECLGIIPETDISIGRRVLHIQRTRSVEHGKEIVTPCKTENSDRNILLDDEDLERIFRIRKATGGKYLCNLSPASLEKQFRKLIRSAGLPPIRFHDLRHSFATYMLECGINPKIVSDVLGHSNVGVTLDIYRHPDVMMQAVCLQAMRNL